MTRTVVEHVADNWHNITVVTADTLYHCGMRSKKRNAAIAAIENGDDPKTTLAKGAPMGETVKSAAISDVVGLEWHADDSLLRLHHATPGSAERISMNIVMPDIETRDRIIVLVEDTSPSDFHRSESAANIWHMGIAQLTVTAITVLFTIPLAFAASGEGVDPGSFDRRKDAGLAAIANSLGTGGVIGLGAAIIACMMVWWYIACKNPAVKYVSSVDAT